MKKSVKKGLSIGQRLGIAIGVVLALIIGVLINAGTIYMLGYLLLDAFAINYTLTFYQVIVLALIYSFFTIKTTTKISSTK
jgi:hypothetical protein